MIYYLFGLLLIVWLFLYKLNIPFFFPLVLFFLGWTILLLFFCLVPLDYFFEAFSLKVFLLVSGCLSLFFAGSMISYFFLIPKCKSINLKSLEQPLILSRPIYGISVFLALLYCLVSCLSSHKKIAGYRESENILTELRAQHWEDFVEGKVGFEKIILTFTRPFALLFSVSLCFMKRQRPHCALSILCLIGLFLENLTTAGRFLLGVVVFLFFYLFLVRFLIRNFVVYRSLGLRLFFEKPIFLFFFLVAFLFLICALALFPIARNSLLIDQPDIFISYMYTATVSKSSLSGFYSAMIYGLSYLSDPLAKLTFFIEEAGIENWSAGGSYSFPHIFEPFSKLAGGTSNWLELRSEIALILDSVGTQPNPWATGIRDIVIDFGFFGASIFMFVTGFISTLASFSLLQQGTPLALVLLSILSFWLGAFAFVNISMMGPFFNFFCVVLFIFIFNSYRKVEKVEL